MHSLLEQHTERELSGSHGDRESTEIRVAVFWSLFGIWLQLHATKMGKEEWRSQPALSGFVQRTLTQGEGESNSPGCTTEAWVPESSRRLLELGVGVGLAEAPRLQTGPPGKAGIVPAWGGEPMSKGQWLLCCFRNWKGQTRSPAEDTGGGRAQGAEVHMNRALSQSALRRLPQLHTRDAS